MDLILAGGPRQLHVWVNCYRLGGYTRMNEYHSIKTKTWQLLIPKDWEEQHRTEDGELYFQSADESKGFYISVLHLSKSDHKNDPDGVIETIRQAEPNGFTEMPDSHWSYHEDSAIADGRSRTAVIDALDPAREYRIVAKVIVGLPFVVRASFHDYSCRDYEASKRFFDPIIQSLELRNGA